MRPGRPSAPRGQSCANYNARFDTQLSQAIPRDRRSTAPRRRLRFAVIPSVYVSIPYATLSALFAFSLALKWLDSASRTMAHTRQQCPLVWLNLNYWRCCCTLPCWLTHCIRIYPFKCHYRQILNNISYLASFMLVNFWNLNHWSTCLGSIFWKC